MQQTLFDQKQVSGALFSKDRTHRYCLWRVWDDQKPLVMFIGLNPSTADESDNDPTIGRVVDFAKKWGYGGVYMLNCFSFITANPEELITGDPDGMNAAAMYLCGAVSQEIIFAWGAFPIVKKTGRDQELIKMFPEASALIINKDGSPRHPLYVPGNIQRVKYTI